jgi:hypothetical protein
MASHGVVTCIRLLGRMFGGMVLALRAGFSLVVSIKLDATTSVNAAFETKGILEIFHRGRANFFFAQSLPFHGKICMNWSRGDASQIMYFT